MMKQSLLLAALLLPLVAFAQKLHTFDEIFKIMENSKNLYEIKEWQHKEILPAPDRSNNLNFNNVYLEQEEDQSVLKEYALSDVGEQLMKEAEGLFMKGKYTEAREAYLKLLKAEPTFYKPMTYVGQTYGIEKDWDKAIEWYKNTIEKNYIDYMAHWFLADAYKETGQIDKAVEEITIAQVLNRNNPRIKKALADIYKKKKLKTTDWSFNPQMTIDSLAPGKYEVSAHLDWVGYALTKAVWKYEPGYRESMGEGDSPVSVLEEKECLAVLLVGIVNKGSKKAKSFPEFKALKLAYEHEFFEEYVFYEILLPRYPMIAYLLPKKMILSMKDYVIQVRGKEK